jgi:hypothetical protein
MRKFLLLLLCIFCITGCGPEKENEKNKIHEKEDYFITVMDKKVFVGDDYSLIKTQLGNNYEIQEVPSCAFEGMDKIYTFDNYEFYIYVVNGIEKIYTITLLSDQVSTNDGIKIGSSVSDVVSKYGNGYTDAIGAYTYTKGDTLLTFIFDGDKVVSIEYKLNIEE